jgi:hypothetical protein
VEVHLRPEFESLSAEVVPRGGLEECLGQSSLLGGFFFF